MGDMYEENGGRIKRLPCMGSVRNYSTIRYNMVKFCIKWSVYVK